MNNKLIGLSVGAAIVVILCATLLMPVIQDVTTDIEYEELSDIEGYYSMMNTFTLSDGADGPQINGVNVATAAPNNASAWLVITEKFIAATYDSTSYWNYFVDVNGTYERVGSSLTTTSMTVTNGNATLFKNGTPTDLGPLKYAFVCSEAGDYAGVTVTDAIVNLDSNMVIYSPTSSNNGSAYGNILDGFTTGYWATNGALVEQECTVSYDEVVREHTTLAELTSASGSVLVPTNFEYAVDNDLPGRGLILVLPVLVILAALMMVIPLGSRRD